MKRFRLPRLPLDQILLALVITLGTMAGQHLIAEHVLSVQHLSVWDHLVTFTLTGSWMLPAALLSVVLGAHVARVLGVDGRHWWHRIEQAGLISLVMADLLALGVGLQPLTHTFYDALAPAHHDHSTSWLADLVIGQMLTFVTAYVGLTLVAWRPARLPDWRMAWRVWTLPQPRRMQVASAAAILGILLSILPVQTQDGQLRLTTTQAAGDTCSDSGAPQRSYDVSAINVRVTLNRFGDNDPLGVMYVLTQDIPALRAEEASRQVSIGLRDDLIQPLVIRANLGECVTINFTNQLNLPASFHAQGLGYTVDNAGSAVGNNPNTFAAPNGGTRTYRISMPPANDMRGEGAYYFYSHGASRAQVSHGLFGALVAEPPGSTYLHAQTGDPLLSGWEAIIVDPNGPDFREFTLLWHEIGDERADIFDVNGQTLPVLDTAISNTYRPGSRAMNYRSEPFMDRLLLQQNNLQQMDKGLAYSSYTFGDPATPMPRSYLGEPTKTRLIHSGSEVFHVYHLHGGGTRWRRNPFADDRMEFAQGLKKVPTQNAQSVRLDSQSVAPTETMTLEHECAAGGCQQTAGDYLFHCHIGAHYVAGMWSFWRVYDTVQPDLFKLPDRNASPTAVNSLGLIGQVVEGKTIVPDAQFSDPTTQINLEAWMQQLLPVPGVPFDELDATVWDWIIEYVDGDLNKPLVLGEPETTHTWANHTPQPGSRPDRRPEIMFNPTNARYAWPVLRPHLGKRPPFAPDKHGGTPWAGATATATRPDGMCPENAPNNRFYPVTAIQKPLQVTPNATDPDGMLFVLNEDKDAVLANAKPAEPLVLRSNVGDCVDVILTSSLEDARSFHEYSKVNLHIHFVQFDPQASDGVISGMSFEQSVRPYTTELSAPGAVTPVGRTLTAAAAPGTTDITVSDASRLHIGGAFGIGLDRPNIEIRTIVAINGNVITLDEPLAQSHAAGEPVGVEFVRYRWYSDVDSGTVFYHSHISFTDWYHGLIGAHIIEPPGSTYHDPTTGQPIRSGTIADIHTTGSAGNTADGPWPGPEDGSTRGFREFVVFFTADNPANGVSGGTINLRAAPFALRGTDPARIFSSVTNNDPWTPIFRAYLGDPVMIRGMSVVEKEGALRFSGHRYRPERFAPEGVEVDTVGIDVSERYDLILEGGAGGIQQAPGDYLYYTTISEQFVDGAWGLLRVFDRQRNDLQALPGRPAPPSGPGGFPQQTVTGGAPQSAADPGAVCPANAPLRTYEAVIFNQAIPYSPGAADPAGVIYALAEDEAAIRAGTLPVRPLIVRANVGDCLEIALTNKLAQSASLHAGELALDPQGSYGAAIGFNQDSTVAPNARRVYRYFVDADVGITLFYNLANPATVPRGAFGAIIAEPTGAIYRHPSDGTPVRAGPMADIITPSGSFREFVGLFQDEDDVIGQNQMPYPTAINGFTGMNYVAELFSDRLGVNPDPSLVFATAIHGDPANLLQAHLGDAVRLRIGKPWGTQGQVFSIEGHRYPLEPNMTGSNLLSSRSLRAGEAFDAILHQGAGGQAGAPGDYLFGDMRGPFQEAGVWGLLRVEPTTASGPLPLPSTGLMLEAHNTASAAQIYANSAVDFTYRVDNPGTLPLLNVSVTDDNCSAAAGTLVQTGDGNGDAVLDPGEEWTYTCSVVLAASVTNKLTVSADNGSGEQITAAATASVDVINPLVSLTRPAPAPQVQAGQPIAFEYVVALAPGGVGMLKNVTLTDDACATVTRTGGDTNGNNQLELGESWTYGCTTTLSANVTSIATVNALDAFDAPVEATAQLAIEALTAAIQLEVTVSQTSANPGDTLTYDYTVTNSGSARLENITVDDTLFGPITLNTTGLNSGETATGSQTLVVQENALPGPLAGTVTAAGTPTVPPGVAVNANATTSVDLSAAPSIAVTREAAPAPAGIGETIFYTFTITNDGSTTLSNVVADDTLFGALLQPAVTLNPGQSVVETRALTVDESHLPGPLADTVIVSGTPPANLAVVSAADGGSIDLTYAASLSITRSASPNPVSVGQSINYLFTVKNTGNVTLSNLEASDSLWPVINISVNSLAPGAETTISHVYQVKESDLPGPIENTLTVAGTPPGGLPVVTADNTGNVDVTGSAGIQVNQTSNVLQAEIGTPITFTYSVQNVGDVTLDGVLIDLTYPTPATLPAMTLAPGEVYNGSISGIVQEQDLPGPLVNIVRAQGNPPIGATVTASQTATILISGAPNIHLTMQADTSTATVGETITYQYSVQNTGNLALQEITVDDDDLGSVVLATTTLGPGETTSGSLSYVVVEDDLPGPLVHSARARGRPVYGSGSPVDSVSSTSVSLTSNPALELTIQTSAAAASVGEEVLFTFVVKNVGNVSLQNLSLTDSRFGGISLTSGKLAPGESLTRTRTLSIQESHLPGPLNNSATASGRSVHAPNPQVSSTANATLTLISNPQLVAQRQVSHATAKIGDRLYYTFTVTNAGAETISGLSASDSRLGNIVLAATFLLPGQSTTGHGSYVVKQTDLPGPLTDTFTVNGSASSGSAVNAQTSGLVDLTYTGQLQINHSATPSPADVGDVVTYNFTVINTGDVTLNQLQAEDSLLGTVTLNRASLAPGQQATGQVTRQVLEGDLPGPLSNTFTVTGTPPNGLPPVSASATGAVALVDNPLLTVSQQVNRQQAQIGDTVIFTMTVSNGGNVSLSNVVIEHSFPAPATLPAFTLLPGASTSRAVSYVVQEEDLPGPLTNLVEVSGKPPLGATLSASDSDSVALQGQPSLQLAFAASSTTANVGDTLYYTYTVKNTGDQTLDSISVVDQDGQTLSLPTTSLAPNAQSTGHYQHVVLEDELAGPLTHQLTVTGTPRHGGGAAVGDAASVAVDLTSSPALAVTRTASRSSATVGNTVVYSFTIRNNGDVTLHNLTIVDTHLGELTPGKRELKPGQQLIVSGATVVTENDLPGPLNDEVTVQAQPKYGRGGTLTAKQNGSITLFALPAIQLTQAINTDIANVGETVVYTFTIENIGNVTLVDILLEDAKLGTLEVNSAAGLAPGARLVKIVEYVLQPEDLPGPLNNSATVSAVPIYLAGGTVPTDELPIRTTAGTVSVSSSSITLHYVAVGGAGQPALDVMLNDEPVALLADEPQQFDWLAPGDYTLDFLVADKWALSHATCDNGVTLNMAKAAAGQAQSGWISSSLHLDRSVHVTCTVTTQRVQYDIYLPAALR